MLVCLLVQNNEADAIWQSVSVSAYQAAAVRNATDIHLNDALNEITADNCSQTQLENILL